MKNIFEQLTDLLKKDERLVSQDGVLLKNQTQELARKNDPELIKRLLSDKAIKQHFFFEVEKTLIFDKEKFIRFVSNKQFLPNSYTAFKNKIGLTAGDEYVSENKEVVLAWPYKDCVLEGGMTKEDQKRDEIFYNETLAPDDINRLLDAKVFTNFKRIDKKGEHKLDGFNRDKKGTIKDNLIIKGNNLLALASLKKEFAKEIKLIYIDPPFYFSGNKPEDTFKYNSNFKLSTWLTFIKTRLEISKELLSKDGFIFVHIGAEDSSYIKMLLDGVFGTDKFVNHITMTTNDPSGFKATGQKIFTTSNHLFIYKKETGELNKCYVPKNYDSAYKYVLLNKNDHYAKWKYTTIKKHLLKQNQNIDTKTLDIKIEEFVKNNPDIIFRTAAIGGGAKKKRIKTIEKSKGSKDIVMRHPGDDIEGFYILNGEGIVFWNTLYKDIDGESIPAKALTDVWTDISWTGIAPEGGVTLKNGKKPEKLLKRVIDLATKKNDIVLDYFLASGTTAAVAQKMGRRFIGIEQLDYDANDSVVRLKNVINGDKSGISKYIDVDWRGGGDFVYMELAKWNESWKERIKKAKTNKELAKLWNEMKTTAFLSYKVDPKTIDANTKDFAGLSITDQKKFLIECLDKNQLYVNLSEIEDKEYRVSKEDKELNKNFYGSK